MALNKPCAYFRCGNVVPIGQRYCEQHQGADARRWPKHTERYQESPADRGYGTAWRELRDRVLRERPVCAMCGLPANHVHHIVPKVLGGTDAIENLVSLCAACHSTQRKYRPHNRRTQKQKNYDYAWRQGPSNL